MLIENSPELQNVLQGKTVLLTGAGGGIGFEAAMAFAYLGARIIIAEIDHEKGRLAESQINSIFDGNPAKYYEIDLSDTVQISSMTDYIMQNYGCPDVVFNNATITKMGAIDEVDISFWDKSYAVNFRAPLLLAQKFLLEMKKRKSGAIVFVSSSGASPYMGAYEVFKTAQVELSNTLALELENSGVYTFTIGPGLVKTETAMKSIEIVAKSMGMSTDAFYEMNSQHIIDAESAGVGFALSSVHPERYHGQEIGSIQVLSDFNILVSTSEESEYSSSLSPVDISRVNELLLKIQNTFEQQYLGWQNMNIFERQWVLRDFKKSMGESAEQVRERLSIILQASLSDCTAVVSGKQLFERLREYWKHQYKLLQGYERDKIKLEENSRIINGWIADLEDLLSCISK